MKKENCKQEQKKIKSITQTSDSRCNTKPLIKYILSCRTINKNLERTNSKNILSCGVYVQRSLSRILAQLEASGAEVDFSQNIT